MPDGVKERLQLKLQRLLAIPPYQFRQYFGRATGPEYATADPRRLRKKIHTQKALVFVEAQVPDLPLRQSTGTEGCHAARLEVNACVSDIGSSGYE